MSVSLKIKYALGTDGKTQSDYARHVGTSRQVMSNKFLNDAWSVDDLINVMDFCGSSVILRLKNGEELKLTKEDMRYTSKRGKGRANQVTGKAEPEAGTPDEEEDLPF